jgi:stage II sporulation protein GA (sporulation sigma-E factor processing peptidase)
MTECFRPLGYNLSTGGVKPLKQTIYLDVLIGVNLIINYFLLLAVSKFLSLPAKRIRLIAAALLGAMYSLTILLPEIPIFLSFFVKFVMATTIVLAAFPFGGFSQLLRRTAAFFIMSFSFAGFMLALWYFIAPQGMVIKNSVIYFDISPLLLIAITAVCYMVVRIINRLTGRQAPDALFCRIKIHYKGQTVSCLAKVDTGNSLTEPFSNYPVAVVNEECALGILPKEDSGKIRLVPFHAVSGGGLLPAFKPDLLTVICGNKQIEIHNVYVAVTKSKFGEFGALLNPDLLQKTSA